MSDATFEIKLDFDIEDYVLSFPLVSSTVIYDIGRRSVTDNEIYPGEPFLNGPVGADSRKIYRGGFNVFRVSLSETLLRERASYHTGRAIAAFTNLFGPHVNTDEVIQGLLMAAAVASDSLDTLYIENLGTAIADYLLARYAKVAPKPKVSPLPKWRLARVTEYIDANLTRDISLAELSAVVGVSRMHFAAQFKAAAGITPHAYVLDRRIRAARPLLLSQTLPIRSVALAIGFKTPAHFADAFRRLVGAPPTRWRSMIAECRGQASVFPEVLTDE